MTEEAPDILTPDQVAEYLQVDRETVYRYIRDGRLLATRLGRSYRVARRDIDLLLASSFSRRDIQLREYSDEQVDQFMDADRLDPETERIALELLNNSASHAAD